jgi:predicted enzyme related to lactoylglutathione lyase
MTDPFAALHAPVTPADPDPAFAASLRARLERALALPRGVAVSTITLPPKAEPSAGAEAGAAIPYLAVRDGRRAIDWYVDVLGAQLIGEPTVMPDGVLGHAELRFPNGTLYLAEEFPDLGVVAPDPDATAVSLVLAVPDVDATIDAAVRAEGQLQRGPYEDYGYRGATIVDPFGHRWMLRTPLTAVPAAAEPALPSYRPGDVTYASLWVPDADRAARFFESVLGWSYVGGRGTQRQHVAGHRPSQGLYGGQSRSTLFCCYVVNDVAAAVERVRAAGGRGGEPAQQPYGLVADCVDDQGMSFALCEPPADDAVGVRPPPNGTEQGDISYITLEVPDYDRARAFYGAVLGWDFSSPGQAGDPVDVVPMFGISGGHSEPAGVPMWRVDDVAAAVTRVRSAGGTSTEPQQRPYGVTAECTDDQGTRFYLGQDF